MKDKEIDYEKMLPFYNTEMAGIYNNGWNPFATKIPDMTFMQWYDMIKEKAKTYQIDN